MAYNQIKYPEIFTENGSSPPASTTTAGKTLTLKSLPAGLTAANATTYKVWIGPAATAISYFIQSANITGKTITLAVNVTVALSTQIWIGKASTPVAAGLSQFYVRSGVIIPAGALVRFQASGENFRASNPSIVSNNLVQLSASVSSTSPSIGAIGVFIGGYLAAATDTVTFTEIVSKNKVSNRGASDTLTFTQTVSARRLVPGSTADAVTFSDGVATRATLNVSASETITILSSVQGGAAKQFVYTTDRLRFADSTRVNKQIIVSLSQSITFSDLAYLPKRSFTTPLTKVVPPILPETRGQQYLLYRHYASTYRHVNVFQLSNGTYVQDYPTVENGNANVPYPWITDSPDNQYAFVTYWNGTTQAFTLDPHINQVFWGGEVSYIDQDTANQMMREHPLYADYMDTTNA